MSYNSFVNQIETNRLENPKDNESFRTALENLDNLIRNDKSVRESIGHEFYSALLPKLRLIIPDQDPTRIRWPSLTLILKCLKNSAGIFRQRFSASESELCDFIVDSLSLDFDNNDSSHSVLDLNSNKDFRFNSYLYMFQYIFNLVQGN